MENTNPFYDKMSHPFRQAVLVLAGMALIMIITKLLQVLALMDIPARFHWKTATALLFFFAIFNSIFSLKTDDKMKYWRDSTYSFIVLVILGGGLAWLASGMSIYETGSYYAIYVVVTFGFLVFSTITFLIRKIVDYAENEKWEAPRKPKKN